MLYLDMLFSLCLRGLTAAFFEADERCELVMLKLFKMFWPAKLNPVLISGVTILILLALTVHYLIVFLRLLYN
jgi:hypothetical protein